MLRKDGGGLTDGELLECFTGRQDEAAFEGLLRRHGAMVLGVCRRVLGNEADAEDAFQATFLILVRKAASVRPPGLVGNWLYGVARTTALKAKAMRSKRHAKEHEAALERCGQPTEARRELQALLEQELQGLPDRYRAAIVLCDLEGKPIKEAARQLGCPQGTIGSRLTRGRVLLARRLARHGLTFSGGLIATVLCEGAATATLPAPLLVSTMKAASLFAAGQAAAGVTGAKVAALTEGVLKAMLLTKIKIGSVVLFAGMVLASAGLMTAAQDAPSGPGLRASKDSPPAKAPALQPDEDAIKRAAEAMEKALTKGLAELKKTKAYVLTEKEVLKCIQPPFPDARQACLRAISQGEDRTAFLEFRLTADNKMWLQQATWAVPGGDESWALGIDFAHSSALPTSPPSLLTSLGDLGPKEIEGDKELLESRIGVDFVLRHGTPLEKIVPRLETILKEELKLPVKLNLREVKRKVFVAGGKYKFTAAAGSPGERIEIYAKELTAGDGSNTGDLPRLLKWVGRFIDRRIVLGKVENAPGNLAWHENYGRGGRVLTDKEEEEDHDPQAVLQHLTEQTGLSFREETRPVRVLFVERVEK
jgi:RNA polymerase sigma factor (sigma-70 family)